MARALRQHSSGFTLIEILAVVVILAITAALIVPYLGSRADLKLSAAARCVISDLLYAQNRAITTQAPVYVQFDTTNKRYALYDQTSSMTIANAIDHPLKPGVFSGKYVTAFGSTGPSSFATLGFGSVSFAGRTTLGFDELGAPFGFNGTTATDLTSTGVIRLTTSPGSGSIQINIEPLTGESSVQ